MLGRKEVERALCIPSRLDDVFDSIFAIMDQHMDWVSTSIPEFVVSQKPVTDIYVVGNGSTVIEMAVTGYKKDELNVDIENSILTIKGTKTKKPLVEQAQDFEAKKRILSDRIFKGDFTVQYRLSYKQDVDKISTKLEDGILTIRIPVKDEHKEEKKKIEIK